jgi:hypothetical protein
MGSSGHDNGHFAHIRQLLMVARTYTTVAAGGPDLTSRCIMAGKTADSGESDFTGSEIETLLALGRYVVATMPIISYDE